MSSFKSLTVRRSGHVELYNNEVSNIVKQLLKRDRSIEYTRQGAFEATVLITDDTMPDDVISALQSLLDYLEENNLREMYIQDVSGVAETHEVSYTDMEAYNEIRCNTAFDTLMKNCEAINKLQAGQLTPEDGGDGWYWEDYGVS